MEEHLSEITAPGKGELRDRGSRFYAYAYPVREMAEIDAWVLALEKQYHDARHHCYAYRLGVKGETTYATDDGEPSHSAGTPILSAIRAASLTHTLVVVIRYFGGTKLGVRGLIDAYRGAAADALDNLAKRELVPSIAFTLRFSYEQTSHINRLLHPFELQQLQANYTERCELTYGIREGDYPGVERVLQQAGIEPENVHSYF
ncbi:MAG: YigZ family protein [Bacteroidota bacterium]